MKKNYKINLIFIIILLILFLINNNLVLTSILNYTKIFIENLFPSIFIIYIITSLLIDYGIINIFDNMKLNGNILYVIIMSFLSGFPSSSKYIKELLNKNLITTDIANYLIMFTHFPNPFFILNIIKNIIGISLTKKLYISIILSNILISIIFKKKINIKKSPISKNISNINFSMCLNKATINTIKLIIIIYSSSLFFYLINIIINKYITFYNELYIIINCIFDLTTGLIKTSIIENKYIKSIIILIFLSIGNLPIHIQIKSIISDTNISYKSFVIGRIIELIFALIIFNIIILI